MYTQHVTAQHHSLRGWRSPTMMRSKESSSACSFSIGDCSDVPSKSKDYWLEAASRLKKSMEVVVIWSLRVKVVI